jgi:hypothetical protein
MALIEEYHVVADMYSVDSDTNPNLIEGQVVTLNADGEAIQCDTSSRPIGVAGDSSESSGGHTPYSADLIISPQGQSRSTSNRVTDFFEETAASGHMTVYNSGGKFWTDQFNASDNYTPGDALFCDANAQFTTVDTGSQTQVAVCVKAPEDYPSGVPGTQVNGHNSLGSFMNFIIVI